jgi:hypothetical protein
VRRRRAAISLVIGLLGLGTFAAPVAAQRPAPSAKELWETYPLTEQSSSQPPAHVAPPSRTTPNQHPPPADGGGVPWALLAAVCLLPVAVGATLAVRRRRRGTYVHDVRNEAEPMSEADIPEAAASADVADSWVAEITWDQGDQDAVFRAIGRDEGTGEEVVVAESEYVEWPPRGTDAVAAMRQAVDELEAALLDAGWSRSGRGRAWYAKRFRWEPAHVAEPSMDLVRDEGADRRQAVVAVDAPGLTEEELEGRWRCEIRWAPGYVNSRFVAVRYAPEEKRGSDLGGSRSLRWMFMNDPDPRVADDREALRELCEALLASGWVPAGRGRPWYAHQFVWQGDDEPPDQLDPAMAAAMEAS